MTLTSDLRSEANKYPVRADCGTRPLLMLFITKSADMTKPNVGNRYNVDKRRSLTRSFMAARCQVFSTSRRTRLTVQQVAHFTFIHEMGPPTEHFYT